MSAIPDNGKEKRQSPRYKADGIGIHSNMILASYLKIIDVSLGGMSFEADRRLNMGKKYSLNIKSQGVLKTVKGIVVWCSLTKNIKNNKGDIVPIYKCGMKFMDIEPAEIKQIIDSVKIQKKEIEEEAEKEYIDLDSDFMQEQDQKELEDLVNSFYE
jgi:hypothetical protein